MTTTTVLPVNTYLAGPHNVGPIVLADSVTSIGIAVQRCTNADLTIWPNLTDTITFDIQVSMNGGVTWEQWFNGSNSGGINVSPKTGLQVPTTNVQGSIPPGTGRQMKATITLSADIKTGATVTVL